MSNPTSDPLDAESIRNKLEALKSEHRDLDEVIARLLETPPFDQLQLQRALADACDAGAGALR